MPCLDPVALPVGQQHAEDPADQDGADRMVKGDRLLEERHREGRDREPPRQPLSAAQADRQRGQPEARQRSDKRIGVGHVDGDQREDPAEAIAASEQRVGERRQRGRGEEEGRQGATTCPSSVITRRLSS